MNFNRAGGFAGCLIVTVALGGSAVAEDFPAQKSQPLPSWTGFYGGLNTGGEFGDLNVADPNGRPPPSGRGGWHGGGWRGGGWHGGLGPSSYGGRVSTPGAISGLLGASLFRAGRIINQRNCNAIAATISRLITFLLITPCVTRRRQALHARMLLPRLRACCNSGRTNGSDF